MPATLDLLEAKRAQTYAALLDQGSECPVFEEKVRWLEEQIRALYLFAIKESREDLSVREVFELWDKMVSICDFFIDHVRIMASSSQCEVCYNRLLDLRFACDDKREFHRCFHMLDIHPFLHRIADRFRTEFVTQCRIFLNRKGII
jgi:hypothetical protein